MIKKKSIKIIIIFIIFIFPFFILWIFTKNKKIKNTLFDKIVDKVNVFSTILIPIGIYLTYQIFDLQLQQEIRDATFNTIDRSFIKVNKDFIDYFDECPNFINSLFFDWQRKVLGKIYGSEKQDNWYSVNYLSNSIFQAWEDFLTTTNIDETGDNSWITSFLEWSNSDILKKNWSVLKINYNATTIELGDYMFKMVSLNKPKNISELNNIATLIIESERYKTIIKNRTILHK